MSIERIGSVNHSAYQEPSVWTKIKEIAQKVYDVFKKQVWPYVNDLNKIARKTITVIAAGASKVHQALKTVVAKMGILSFISVLFSVDNMRLHIKSLINNLEIKDKEGITLAILSILTEPIDALDSLITGTEALVAFGAIPVIAFFGLIALPIAITLVTYGLVRSLYSLIQNGIHYHQLPSNIEEFNRYVEKKLDITPKEKKKIEEKYKDDQTKIDHEIKVIKDRKRNTLSRHTDTKVVNIMENLRKHLKKNKKDKETAAMALSDMKKIMVAKITWGTINAASLLALDVALICAAIFPIASGVLPAIAGTRFGIALEKRIYMDYLADRVLEKPEWT